jgi:RNA polymerase sigma-70 factor (ECF subfamily)
VRGVVNPPEAGGVSDGQLLELFLARRDEAAFAELVRRHGPMVLGVCRRILGNSHDADDAFQATFLVLVRRAAAVRPRSRVGNFLYGVACRTALEARRAAARRRRKEASVMPRSEAPPAEWSDLVPVLDQELRRLPDRYRAPLLLCDIEGKTRKEAAVELGWPEGTVSSRLARARALLARRLARHGLSLSAAVVAELLTQNALAAVPAPLVVSSVKAALLPSAGQAVGAAILAERVVRAMAMLKWKVATTVLLAGGLLGLAAYQVGTAHGVRDEKPTVANVERAAPARPEGEARKRAPDEKEGEKKERVSVKDFAPVVVQTVPKAGDTKVDAAKVKEIRVTFSKDMADKSWSFTQISDETFPRTTGKIHYDKDRRTCVMPVKLEPGKTYVIWLNPAKFQGFRDTDGKPAMSYLLVFETKPAE